MKKNLFKSIVYIAILTLVPLTAESAQPAGEVQRSAAKGAQGNAAQGHQGPGPQAHKGQAAEKSAAGPGQGKGPPGGALRGKREVLACRLGTEDRHARIAVELIGGRTQSVAYYSKVTPRTCSVNIMRNDAFSRWEDSGHVTVVTLTEDKGAFLIDHERRFVKFLFREIDRERFCGMPGKITGSLTVTRGSDRCELEGVMDGHELARPEDPSKTAVTP
jgi:hypothetical protein